MKKVVLFIITILLFTFQYVKATDSVKVAKPEPFPEKEMKFPEYKIFTLDNGLKVFVIEDHKQPTVYFRLLVSGGKSVDTLKPGIADLTSSLLTKGTKKLKALELAKTIDGIGASISAYAGTDFVTVSASGLKKHLNTILDIYSQVITNPVFPETEFNKLIPQMFAAIQQEKSEPRTIASKMARRVIYGEEHPYALNPTENSVKKITITDIKNYYEHNFAPNNSTLAIIGDVKPNEILKEIKKYFNSWKQSNNVFSTKIAAMKSLPLGVYFIERPGSTQSTIIFSTKAVAYTHKDYDLLSIASNVISGGIAGRLFRTLREEHSYTYTPFGELSQNKFAGRYFCGADVKNPVTDSAIIVMMNQISSLAKNSASEEELSRVKTYQSGTYKMAFESSDYVASLIQEADFYGKPISELETYPNRIMSYTANSIKAIASQYLNPSQGYLIVVGNPEIKQKLSQFGKIYDYDLDLNALSGEKAKLDPVKLNAQELIEKYTQAIGGKENLNNIQTIIDTANIEMKTGSDVITGSYIQYRKSPDKNYMDFDMKVFRQQVWVDGKDVWLKINQVDKLGTDEAEKFINDSYLFKETKLLELGYTCTILGKKDNLILMKAISQKGFSSTYYFDGNTFLINKIERVETVGNTTLPVTENIIEYIEISGVKLPKILETVYPENSIKTENNYLINQPIDDNMFLPLE